MKNPSYLLDANVLISLILPEHQARPASVAWFQNNHRRGWATCPIVENALIRVLANPDIPGHAFSPTQLVEALKRLSQSPGYSFVPDDLSIVDETFVNPRLLTGIKQVTDAYLVALCRKHGLKLVTTDRRIEPALCPSEGVVELI